MRSFFARAVPLCVVICVSLREWRAGLIAAVPDWPLTLRGTFAVMRWSA